jgi:dolichol kinase
LTEGSHPDQRLEELAGRTEGLQPWRRLSHVVCGAGIALVVYTLEPQSVPARWLLGGLLGITFLADACRLRSDELNRFVFRTFGALMCPREARRLSLTWFLLGVFLTVWFPGEGIAVAAILVLSVADPAASVVGRLWGRHRLGKGTLEGTLTFFAVAVAVLFPFVGIPAAIPVAAFVALIEVLPTGLDDNLLIPVATAGGLWALAGLT